MNLQSTIDFLTRLYDNPRGKNLTRLEHEAIGEAIRRLRALLDGAAQSIEAEPSKGSLRIIRGGKRAGIRRREQRNS